MDRLRSVGGCPWDAEQTHASLAPYTLEESYELVEAIEHDDRAGLREELGDVLLQVVFHARVAQEHPTDPFGLDEVADGVTAKLVRRHPHVFVRDAEPTAPDDGDVVRAADVQVHGAPASASVAGTAERLDGMHAAWDLIKADEKRRASVLDGIPLAQGALARGQKIIARARRAGLDVPAPSVREPLTQAELARRLVALVAAADASGLDAEAVLRAAVRAVEDEVRAQEQASHA